MASVNIKDGLGKIIINYAVIAFVIFLMCLILYVILSQGQKITKKVGVTGTMIDVYKRQPYNCRAGVGILIYDQRDQRQGYASHAVSIVIRYGFQVLNLNQLYCDIPSQNIQSLALFKSKGFSVIGLKKEWTKTTSDWQDEYKLQLLNPKKW